MQLNKLEYTVKNFFFLNVEIFITGVKFWPGIHLQYTLTHLIMK